MRTERPIRSVRGSNQQARRSGNWLLIALLGCLIGSLAIRAQPAPTPDEQDRILESMHRYSAQYISSLPNFLCIQVTRQFEAGVKSERWHEGDTLTSKLSFNLGLEQRSLYLVNGKPVERDRRHISPLTTEGEFGILLSRVLGPDSEASFTWSDWETVHGKRLAVFDFAVDQRHSTLSLTLSDLARAIVPYEGSVYGDPSTGVIWRISDKATKIPGQLRTREIATTIDYDEIAIGEKKYLLPTAATVFLLLETKKVRNEMEFRDYRKFEADSSITFGEEAPVVK